MSGEYLLALSAGQNVVVISIILVSEQGAYGVFVKCSSPVQLLLECVILVSGHSSVYSSVIAFSVSDGRVVERVSLVVAQSELSFHCKGEILQELDVHIECRLNGITDISVFVQFVFPDHVAVGILVAGKHRVAVCIGITARIILFVSVCIQPIASVCIVQMHRIDRSDLATIHKCILETAVATV